MTSSSSSASPSPEDRLRQIALAVGLAVKNAGPTADHAAIAAQAAGTLGASIFEAAAIALSIARAVSKDGLDSAVSSAAIDAATQAALDAASISQAPSPIPAPGENDVSQRIVQAPPVPVPPPPAPVSIIDQGKLSRVLATLQDWISLDELASKVGGGLTEVTSALEPMAAQGYIVRERDYVYVTESGHRFFEYSTLLAR